MALCVLIQDLVIYRCPMYRLESTPASPTRPYPRDANACQLNRVLIYILMWKRRMESR
jgi:hypothetical protein